MKKKRDIKKKIRFVQKFCLSIIDEIYDRGYSMNEYQVDKLIRDVTRIFRKP